MTGPRLIVFSGLPGVGKSKIAQELSLVLSASYLGIDACEEGILKSALAPEDVMDAGYRALFAMARENLEIGLDVVADNVNPVTETRNAWRNVAHVTGAKLFEIEVICSDEAKHRSRVETRHAKDATQPDWANVTDRLYSPRTKARIVIDTASAAPDVCVADLLERI